MKVDIHIDRSVEEIKVLITAQEQNQKVDSLYEHIVEFDKKRTETLTAYRNDIVKIVNVTDIQETKRSIFKQIKANMLYGTDYMSWMRLLIKNSFFVSLIQKS